MSDLRTAAADARRAAEENRLRDEADQATRRMRDVEARLKMRDVELRRLEKEFDLLSGLDVSRQRVKPWMVSKPRKSHHGIPVVMLSDLHFDEVVRAVEVEHVNAYNRDIAVMRLRSTFESIVKITRDYWSGISYDGIVVLLGGDMFAGNIHDELKETNEDTIFGSLLFWFDHLAAGLAMLGEVFGKVHVAAVAGNHGRLTRKPRAKYRARDNADWFLAMMLAKHFATNKRFTFNVPDSADATIPVYDKVIRLTHGDQTSGGAGIGGIWPPIMRLNARKTSNAQAVSKPYDLLVLGHWHQLVFGPNFIVNGSLPGFDEYASVSNFGFQPPAQALWLMTPEHGRTWMAPIYPMDRKAEGW